MSLQKALGSFGAKIVQGIKGRLRPIAEAIGIADRLGVSVRPPDLWREYRKVIKLEGISEQLATLSPEDYVPTNLWQGAEIPWKRPYAYEVTISGRDLATGRFARTQRTLTYSRELTVAEVLEEASAHFGKEGAYPQLDISHLSVTAAWSRE